jgi:hypothetical protein
MAKEGEAELFKAIQGALGNPNLPSYMFISNFDYLVDQGGYLDKKVRSLESLLKSRDSRKLHSMNKFDIDKKNKINEKIIEKNKDDNKTVGKIHAERAVEVGCEENFREQPREQAEGYDQACL